MTLGLRGAFVDSLSSRRMLLARHPYMKSFAAFAAGAAAGVIIVRERRARRSAERLAGAALEALLNAIDANDAQTGAHVRRVASFALIIADAAGLRGADCQNVELVGL